MEYPTLITTGASRLMQVPPLEWSSWIETVTVHEFGHQYFQGLLASNEFESAWIDEGMTSWAEVSCTEAIREHGLVPEMKAGGFWARKRLELAFMFHPVRIDRFAWEFRSRSDYSTASYAKTSVVLKTLEGLLGPEVFYRAMRAYYDRHRFSHPRGEDFFRVVEEISGEDLDWFFDQAIGDDVMPDWAVLRVRNAEKQDLEGFEWQDGEWIYADESEPEFEPETEPGTEPGTEIEGEEFLVEIQLGRVGDFIAPVDVRIDFADGSSETRTWDSEERWVKWHLETTEKVEGVVIDPLGVWVLEVNRADNYWRAESKSRPEKDPLWWLADGLKLIVTVALPWS